MKADNIGKEPKRTDMMWIRVDSITKLILEKPEYLQDKRTKELESVICKQFNIGNRQARKYIKESKEVIRQMTTRDRETVFKKAIIDREYLIIKAKDTRDLRLVLEILKDRDKLFGLYIDETRNVTDINLKSIDLSKFTERGLERITKGDKIEEIVLDPASIILPKANE